MNTVSKKIEINDYLKKIEKRNKVIQEVLVVNTQTNEAFPTNEVNAFADFERLTKKYGIDCSLYVPAGNTGR